MPMSTALGLTVKLAITMAWLGKRQQKSKKSPIWVYVSSGIKDNT
jgi:hypothetical protein